METLTFRPASPPDAERLAVLNEALNGPGTATAEQAAAALAGGGTDRVFVACAGQEPVGFLCAQVQRSMCYPSPYAEITELYVDPRFRRRGAASGLIRLALAALAREGAEEIHLLTGEDNTAARRLYESAGFRLDGEVYYEKG